MSTLWWIPARRIWQLNSDGTRGCSRITMPEVGKPRSAPVPGVGRGEMEFATAPLVLPSSRGVASHSLCFSFHSRFPARLKQKFGCFFITHSLQCAPGIHCEMSYSSERTKATVGKKSQIVASPFFHKSRSFQRFLHLLKIHTYLLLKNYKEIW